MAKKKKNQKPKTPKTNLDIESSSLLPARHDGEKPDLPFNIKEEPEELNVADILSLIEAEKHNTKTSEDAESSSHSNLSTATEPMDTNEGTIHDSGTDDFSEYQVVPSLFEVKQEPMVAGNQELSLGDYMPNNHPENSPKNIFSSLINSDLLQESVENGPTCQGIIHQEMINNATIKTETIENSEDIAKSQNYSHEKLMTKRKSDIDYYEEKLVEIRKRLKKEPNEDGQNLYVPVNENQMAEVDDENLDAEAEENDNDIAVIPVPKIQKKIVVITISDEEDDQNSTPENVPAISSPKKIAKKNNFSIDILKYFNVVSQLDRHDCQTVLDYLSKYKTKHILQKIFPFVKKEKSNSTIEKGDILFRHVTTERESDTERPFSPNVNSYFLKKLPAQHATASENVTFSFQPTAASQNVNFSFPPALVPQYVNLSDQSAAVPALANSVTSPSTTIYPNLPVPVTSPSTTIYPNLPVPVTSQSTTIYPNLPVPVSSNFGLNVSQNPQVVTHSVTSHPMTSPSTMIYPNLPVPVTSQSTTIYPNLPVPVSLNFGLNVSQNPQVAASLSTSSMSIKMEDLQNILENVEKQHPGLKLKDLCQNLSNQNLPLQDPCQNSSVLDPHQNSPLQDQNPPVQDPRLRKKTLLDNGNNIQIINTPFIPSLRVAPSPNQEYQSFPGPSTSYPTRVAVASCTQMNPDPLFVDQKVTFPNRKGKKNLLLYHNVGRDDITQHFETLILQWNPSWMEIQKRTGIWPPISNFYPSVVYSYRNEMDYYNTYVPLHLLHVWYSIYQCWEKETFTVINRCKVQSVEKSDNGIKISCSVKLEDTQVWPKRDDIIWCKHNKEMAFLRVEDVQMKPISLSKISKLKITLRLLDDLNLKLDDEIKFCILWNIDTAFLQTESLNSLDSSIKELILKPECHESCIGIVDLNGINHIKQQRDSVFEVLKLDSICVIVIQTYQYNYNSVLMLTHLSFNISYNAAKFELIPKNDPKQQFKVLIIIKNDELIHRLFQSLSQYRPVLAVRTKQISLPSDLIRYTLEDRLHNRENLNDILRNHHIFITTFSAFGNAEKTHLSKLRNLICIIDDAHLCTEVETALPLTLRIKKLLLIGIKFHTLNLPEVLINKNYHISLFLRLLKAKC